MSVTMPTGIGRLPFFPVEFDKRQRPVDPEQLRRLRTHLADGATTDLLVASHGWNNDKEDALKLYRALLTNIGQQAPGRWAGREVAVLGVFWPSKKFADSDLIPGGAASVAGDIPTQELIDEIEQLRGFFDDGDQILDRLRDLAPRVADSGDARREFAAAIRELVAPGEDAEVRDEIPTQFFGMDGADMLEELGAPREEELAAVEGGDRQGGIAVVGGDRGGARSADAEGGAAFLGSAFSGLRSGARNALNLATYYTMKRRAGETGQRGVAPALRQVRGDHPDLRIHLAGHSFGGRLVAAAALGEGESDPALPVDSITLLQAAFSHNGFAEDYEPGKHGYFRRVLTDKRVRGPLVVTHTRKDRANTWAYPMASRLARQKAAAFGGPDDAYGAIGTNGALKANAKTGELLAVGGEYGFSAGEVRNLESSAFIGDHGAVTGPEVAHAIVEAVASS